jgi:hypothetical protein
VTLGIVFVIFLYMLYKGKVVVTFPGARMGTGTASVEQPTGTIGGVGEVTVEELELEVFMDFYHAQVIRVLQNELEFRRLNTTFTRKVDLTRRLALHDQRQGQEPVMLSLIPDVPEAPVPPPPPPRRVPTAADGPPSLPQLNYVRMLSRTKQVPIPQGVLDSKQEASVFIDRHRD